MSEAVYRWKKEVHEVTVTVEGESITSMAEVEPTSTSATLPAQLRVVVLGEQITAMASANQPTQVGVVVLGEQMKSMDEVETTFTSATQPTQLRVVVLGEQITPTARSCRLLPALLYRPSCVLCWASKQHRWSRSRFILK
ncbi:hypothetical protein J6590_001071 [Homalodisca vitripennis]|nr:hypothetical protein J6590_001071 [Homalodisca vitripennis]